MKTFAVIAAVAGLAFAAPSSVAADISPTASAPAGCSTSYSGSFEIYVAAESKKRSTALVLTLEDSVLKDAEGRYGYIASNYQFQFDNPIQAGAIYTSGWSVCSNGSLALGGSTVFYECLSGTFYNLYDEDVAAQCTGIELKTLAVSGSGISESSDGQVTAASASTVVETILCQITDGQVQANTCLTTVTYSAKTTSSVAVVTQISDGQIQAASTTAASTKKTTSSVAVVSQISDGQIQATTASNSTKTTVASTGSVTSTSSTTDYTGAAAAMKVEYFGLAAGLVALAAL